MSTLPFFQAFLLTLISDKWIRLVCHEQDHWQQKFTVLWHVDDLKTSHVDPAIVFRVLAEIDAEYGKIAKLTITRGKVHKYLGTTIDYFLPVKVILSMIDYIGKMIDDIPKEMKGESATPADTTFLTQQKMQRNYPNTTQIFSTILWHNYYIFQRGYIQTSRYKYPSYALEWEVLTLMTTRS